MLRTFFRQRTIRATKRTSPVIGACLKHYGYIYIYVLFVGKLGVDLRAHELWYLILVVVLVVVVMALFRGGGGDGRWRA